MLRLVTLSTPDCHRKKKRTVSVGFFSPLPATVSFSPLTASGQEIDSRGEQTKNVRETERRDKIREDVAPPSRSGGGAAGGGFGFSCGAVDCVLSLSSPHSQQQIEGKEGRWGPRRKQQITACLYLCSSGLHQRAGISQGATGFTLYAGELKGLKQHRSQGGTRT